MIVCILAISVLAMDAGSATRYLDDVFDNVTVRSDIPYGSNVNYNGSTVTLRMDLYEPQGDTARARPVMLFFFGGAFAFCSKTADDMVLFCKAFARKGYVTSAVQYRVNPTLLLNATAAAEGTAILRAVQDARAAVRFLRAHKDSYRIDDTRIMVGGTSAGGVIGVNYAYLDADEIPAGVDTTQVGGIEGASGTPGVSSAINGVINCWGCMGDSTCLYNEELPIISFHGTADRVVPYDVGYSMGNENLVSFGSACIHRVLTREGVNSVLKPFVGMDHGVPSIDDARYDTIVTMASRFAFDVLFTDSAATLPQARLTERSSRPFVTAGLYGRAWHAQAPAPSEPRTVYAPNGRAVGVLTGGRQRYASGVYLVRPSAKVNPAR
jgi:poly(3-hydroxybutyrate) depolymerase